MRMLTIVCAAMVFPAAVASRNYRNEKTDAETLLQLISSESSKESEGGAGAANFPKPPMSMNRFAKRQDFGPPPPPIMFEPLLQCPICPACRKTLDCGSLIFLVEGSSPSANVCSLRDVICCRFDPAGFANSGGLGELGRVLNAKDIVLLSNVRDQLCACYHAQGCVSQDAFPTGVVRFLNCFKGEVFGD